MIEVLAAIGLIVLYFIWLLSPIIMFTCLSDGEDVFGKLACIAYVGGACVIFYVLFKFVGIT